MADAGFGPDDVDLLVAVLERNESMLSAVQAVQVVERNLGYPVKDVEQLESMAKALADEQGEVTVGMRTVSIDQLRTYVDAESFPVEDRDQLISVVLAGFEMERMKMLEQLQEEQKNLPPEGEPAGGI
jgi:hypothetical protein